MAGIYGIGVKALNVAQLSLLTTQHNIANVNTPGFNRQQVLQATSFAQPTGSGFVGQGAQIESIRRRGQSGHKSKDASGDAVPPLCSHCLFYAHD